MRHIIKKQVIDFEIDKKQDAFRMQSRLSEYYYTQILPALELLFTELCPENAAITIEKLEIDIGSFSDQDLEKNRLKDVLVAKIKQQLNLVNYSKGGSEGRPLNVFRQWVYYMEHGYLPWNTPTVDRKWLDQVLEAIAVDFESVAELRKMIRINPHALKRIIVQHSEEFLKNIIAIVTASDQKRLCKGVSELQQLFECVSGSHNEKGMSVVGKFEIWKEIMLFASSGERTLTTEKIVEHILRLNHTLLSRAKENIKTLLPELTIINEITAKVMENPVIERSVQPRVKESLYDDIGREDESNGNVAPIDEEGIFVESAGVVLLHPFLTEFFKRLSLLRSGDSFIDSDTRQKAVYLLHFLVTGKKQAEEYQLLMPKILAACPLSEAIEKSVRLFRREIKEANNLLDAVLGQWKILKGTCPQSLREGFLQRNGKLFRKNDKLYLQVEVNAIDVLLDHLPWNLSMIKLPWMEDMLRVEWR